MNYLLEEWIIDIPDDMFDNEEEMINYAIYEIREEVNWGCPSWWDSWVIGNKGSNYQVCVIRLSKG